jgi:drug/metabolite transporter (DMT)-like permease
VRYKRLKLAAAFAVIYVVWGSTFLAIKIGVERVDPLFLAAMRFVFSGAIVYVWARARGEASPSLLEWRNAFFVAALMFLVGYGCLFWAEKRIASGLAALVLATIPIWCAVLETFAFRMRPASPSIMIGSLVGAVGVALLVWPGGKDAAAVASAKFPALVLVGSASAWALGTLLLKRLTLPRSRIMSAGVQMFAGGVLLTVAAVASGARIGSALASFDGRSIAALAYLALAGSVLAFSVYVWLLDHVSPTKVSTYAFANPVVAVLIGISIGGERLTTAEWIGGAIVLGALTLILLAREPARYSADVARDSTAAD